MFENDINTLVKQYQGLFTAYRRKFSLNNGMLPMNLTTEIIESIINVADSKCIYLPLDVTTLSLI